MFSSDPVIDYIHHEMEMERKLHRLPVCSICGEHIQDVTALLLDGEWICDRCVKDNTTWVEEYDYEETEGII